MKYVFIVLFSKYTFLVLFYHKAHYLKVCLHNLVKTCSVFIHHDNTERLKL